MAENLNGLKVAIIATDYFEQAELQKAGFTPAMFDNLNTAEDLARAERRLAKG